jgi:lysozyme
MLHGVDVAVFQGSPGSWASAAGAIVWAGVKLTELQPKGVKYLNPDAKVDMDWLHANGKGRVAYLFGHPSVSATDTVDYFLQELNHIGLYDSDAVALDLEVTDGLAAADVAKWGVDVQSQLKTRLGREPLLYTFIDFANEGNCAGLGDYPLWIADPSHPAGQPEVPKPWTKWAIHQYGTSNNIDLDVADYSSLAAMVAALGRPNPPEPVLQNLGGDSSSIAATEWGNGQIVVAGIGTDSYVYRTTYTSAGWSAWVKVSPTTAKGSVALISSGTGAGSLFYIETSGQTVQMTTSNYGDSWS